MHGFRGSPVAVEIVAEIMPLGVRVRSFCLPRFASLLLFCDAAQFSSVGFLAAAHPVGDCKSLVTSSCFLPFLLSSIAFTPVFLVLFKSPLFWGLGMDGFDS